MSGINAIERADSILELWGRINQLEAVLEETNTALNGYCLEEDAKEKLAAVNRAHTFIGAAQTIADSLARAAGVR